MQVQPSGLREEDLDTFMALQVQPIHDGGVRHGSLQPHPLCLQQCHDGTDEPDAADGRLWLRWLPNPLRSWVQFPGSWLGKTAAGAGPRRFRAATALGRGLSPEQPSTQVSKLPRVKLAPALLCFSGQSASTASGLQLAQVSTTWYMQGIVLCVYTLCNIHIWYNTYTATCICMNTNTFVCVCNAL